MKYISEDEIKSFNILIMVVSLIVGGIVALLSIFSESSINLLSAIVITLFCCTLFITGYFGNLLMMLSKNITTNKND